MGKEREGTPILVAIDEVGVACLGGGSCCRSRRSCVHCTCHPGKIDKPWWPLVVAVLWLPVKNLLSQNFFPVEDGILV